MQVPHSEVSYLSNPCMLMPAHLLQWPPQLLLQLPLPTYLQ